MTIEKPGQEGELQRVLGPEPISTAQKKNLEALASNPECPLLTLSTMNSKRQALGDSYPTYKDQTELQKDSRLYLADRGAYVARGSRNSAMFDDYFAATQAALSKCLLPATESRAYSELEIPKRLGFISLNSTTVCEAWLLSRDFILTARHCWAEDGPRQDFQAGMGYFRPSGTTKRYQICGAQTQNRKLSDKTLAEEQLVLRIAPVEYSVRAISVAAPAEVKSWKDLNGSKTPDSIVLFSWLDESAKYDASYPNDLFLPRKSCYVVNYGTDGCFSHFCPTFGGTSGAPIFAKTAGTWKLLGVHIGAAQATGSPPPYPACKDASPNVNGGLVANGDLIKKFSPKE
ncbi:trypsin-like serine peptidase [Cupriavidus malaysiensis]|uniref:trypsin-like serine peptidase n=1 Tax=Cupriavidus malaysiensis TaxID=367825 RepID=UPI0012FF93CC|nr:hypothetical protein [Cupriavidus malaysiensis]